MDLGRTLKGMAVYVSIYISDNHGTNVSISQDNSKICDIFTQKHLWFPSNQQSNSVRDRKINCLWLFRSILWLSIVFYFVVDNKYQDSNKIPESL